MHAKDPARRLASPPLNAPHLLQPLQRVSKSESLSESLSESVSESLSEFFPSLYLGLCPRRASIRVSESLSESLSKFLSESLSEPLSVSLSESLTCSSQGNGRITYPTACHDRVTPRGGGGDVRRLRVSGACNRAG